MATTKSVRLERRQLEAIEDMVERGVAENQSEAHRAIIEEGLQAYGYSAGQFENTALKRYTNALARVCALVGIIWLATTLWLPVALRTPAIAAFSASAGLAGFERVLDRYEPRVSESLRGLVGGERA